MYIIEKIANNIGARSPLIKWNYDYLPTGYLWCPDNFKEIFYESEHPGFVNIQEENDIVTDMTINQEAIDFYLTNIYIFSPM